MPEAPVIRLEDVYKTYQLGKVSVPALRGVSLKIFQGSFTAIVGPSGSGKSTLLNMIGCLDFPTKGKVFLDGQDTSCLSENKLALIRGRKIGFIFQQFNLLPHLNALENVMLPMVFQGLALAKREQRAIQLLELVGLSERKSHLPAELSGGQQQRVAIARAFSNQPEFVIADEPTGNLDSQSGKIVMDVLVRFHQDKKGTIIVVTHDPVIAKYSEQVFHIQDGQIVKNHFQEEKVLWQNKVT